MADLGRVWTLEDTKTDDETKVHRIVMCRACDTKVSDAAAVFRAAAAQVFPNPAGEMKVIITLRYAESVIGISEPTTDFTWFDGYAWTIVCCANCQAHLGWRYDAVSGKTPPVFYGFLKNAVAEATR